MTLKQQVLNPKRPELNLSVILACPSLGKYLLINLNHSSGFEYLNERV